YDYGQCRMAALGWLLAVAGRENKQEELVQALKAARDKPSADARARWDWFYVLIVQQNQREAGLRETWEAVKALAQTADPGAQWLFLNYMSSRTTSSISRRPDRPDTTPPLSPAEQEFMLTAYRRLRQQKPEWLSSYMVTYV